MKLFKFFPFLLIALLCSCDVADAGSTREVKVLQFNIWQEGTVVPGGFDAVADEIIRSEADFVTLSEVRNYHNSRFCDRIVAALAERGATYYSFYSDDTGLLSKYPIIDSTVVYPLSNDEGTIHRLRAKVGNHTFSVYTAHLDYRNCAYYEAYGYNGSTWREQEPVVDSDQLIVLNRKSKRDDAIKAFIAQAKEDVEQGDLVILGGDFNEPSFRDWGEETKDLFDHKGLIVPWDVSVLLTDNGFIDSYRELYPNPVTHPGFTYPSDNKDIKVSQLSWAPKADERDRIDFIYFYPDSRLKLNRSIIVGPSRSIKRNERINEETQDKFVEPIAVWPTDHKALLTTFLLRE